MDIQGVAGAPPWGDESSEEEESKHKSGGIRMSFLGRQGGNDVSWEDVILQDSTLNLSWVLLPALPVFVLADQGETETLWETQAQRQEGENKY